MTYFVISDTHIKVGIQLFRQCIGIIPVGTSCAALFTDLFLYSHEVERSLKKSNSKLAKSFKFISYFIDDLLNISNARFERFVRQIYPKKLNSRDLDQDMSYHTWIHLLIYNLAI